MTTTNGIRIMGWALLAALLAVPAIAMRFTTEVNWTPSDFVTMGVLLGALGVGFELTARASSDWSYRAGLGLALLTGFLLIWVNFAVGVIGSERNDANLLFAGVLSVAVGGACLARFGAARLARAMLATAAAQTLVAVVALVGRLGTGDPSWPLDVIGATAMFDGLWLGAAWLFHRATG